MRLGTTLLALILSSVLGASGLAQQADALTKPRGTKSGVQPGGTKKAAPRKARATASARLRQAQARAAAHGRRANQFVRPPNGAADPLNLANDFGGGADFGINGGFGGTGNFPLGGGNFNPNSGPGATANGGLTGSSDTKLIHGFDGDRIGELKPYAGRGDGLGGDYRPGSPSSRADRTWRGTACRTARARSPRAATTSRGRE